MSDSSPSSSNNGAPAPAGDQDTTPTLEEAQRRARERVNAALIASDASTGKKRKASDADDDEGTYQWYGRNLARSCGVFTRIHTIVEYGVKTELAALDGEDEHPPLTAEEKRLWDSWEIIKNTIPGFGDDMIDLGGDVKLRKAACAKVQHGLKGGRGDDCGSLKTEIIDYLLPPPPPPPPGEKPSLPVLTPPIPKRGKKAPRGMNHPVTAAALRPLKYPDAEETYTKIIDNDEEYPVVSSLLPAFMYPAGHPYNDNDLEDGLLDNHILRAVAKHVYQGPSSALEKPGFSRGKAGNAALNGVTALTARDIAYIACQTRFAISSQESWTGTDDDFSYADFYWRLVDLLAGEDGQPILDRFNFDVFGTSATKKSTAAASINVVDEFEVLQQQRAAKRARLAAASQSAPS
ncbi:hypothetical protein C8F04DRAFT_1280211 [Mycena alexandri]|uniref:Uncharacterized protein n=1 Tax=Mycena alexandri TaxID=1745969 RepID=A0AAD6WLP7_9AGAR|nr:hypothetical protein C8F04DRAFT_1280211 [Mycena alexandri]